MALNDITFIKQDGGIGRTAASEDPISGLIMTYAGSANDVSEFDSISIADSTGGNFPINIRMIKLKYYEELAAKSAIVRTESASTSIEQSRNFIDYHVSEFFRMSPTGTLYLALCIGSTATKEVVSTLQDYAEGKIRQVGVIAPMARLSTMQSIATTLEAQHKPLSILFTSSVIGSLTLDTLNVPTHVLAGRCNVSLLVARDLDPDLFARMGSFWNYGCMGTLLGAVSAAAVNECVGWVQKFPLGLKMPGLITGELIKDLPDATLQSLNDNRLIFVRTHVGDADNYFNDSHTLDVATSDYAYIENVRTMDKAVRGIRANLLPYLNAPLYVNKETGELRKDTVKLLQTTAQSALDDMEKAGELSGYRVEIDPAQNVLATSQVVIIVKNVPVGVMRQVVVKIGFTTKI